jgi:hypothetical protein
MKRWVQKDVVAEDMKEHYRNNQVIIGYNCVNIASRILGKKSGIVYNFRGKDFV